MNKKLSGILGIILSIILLIYFKPFAYKVLNLLDLNISSYYKIISLVLDLIICLIIYILYKKDFRKRNSKDGNIKTIFVFILSLISIVIGMYIFNYIVEFIGDVFNVTVLENEFYNIFTKKLDYNLLLKIISDYLIMPYLYSSIIILSIDKITRRDGACIILSGLLASIIHAFNLSGTLGFVIVNSLNLFLLFSIFAFIFRKYSNIWYIILLYSSYLISNVFIINYIRW